MSDLRDATLVGVKEGGLLAAVLAAALLVVGWRWSLGVVGGMAAVAIGRALVAEVGSRLAARGYHLDVFVSPNVAGIGPEHNLAVFAAYEQFLRRLAAEGS